MSGKLRILIIESGDKNRTEPGVIVRKGMDYLAPFADLEWIPIQGWTPTEDCKRRVAERVHLVDAIVTSPWHQFPVALHPDALDALSRLKVIAGTYDNRFASWVDVRELQKRRITLIDTSRNMTPTVAEFAFAQTLNLLRDIPAMLEVVRKGGWQSQEYSLAPRRSHFVYGDLAGRRVGLAGFGSINRRYSEFARAFNCQMMTCDPFVSDDTLQQYGVQRVDSLVELASRSEIFVIGIPPTPTTMKIITKDVINALPTGSLFVLVTRMQVVEQEALWGRIRQNEIRAAIDVFDPEPPPADAWFRSHPNCLCSPHIAGGVFYCHERCFTSACEDAIAVLQGRRPVYPATPWDASIYSGNPATDLCP